MRSSHEGARVLRAVVALAVFVTFAVARLDVPAAASTPAVTTLTPARLLDTRAGETTVDGSFAGVGRRAAESTLELVVTGRGGVDVSAAAVSINVTVTDTGGPGFVTVWPCGVSRPTASNVNYAVGQTVANAVISGIGEGGRVCFYTLAALELIVDVTGWFGGGGFEALPAPARLADTRAGGATVDSAHAGAGLRPSGSTLELDVAGRAGLAAGVSAVVLNVTVTEVAGPGFVTVWPCGSPRPLASNVNYVTAGSTVPNLVIAGIGVDGRVCVFTSAETHFVVDVAGSLPDGVYEALPAPRRVFESRVGEVTVDGRFAGAGSQGGRSTLQLTVAGRAGVPAHASAVILNVTAVFPSAPGFLTIHPRGTGLPTASNVNYGPGMVVANTAIARVGVAGQICVFTLARADIVIDVAGWITGPPPPQSGDLCPPTAGDEPGATDTLVRRPVLHRAVGVDRIAVIACDMPSDGFYGGAIDPAPTTAWANEFVAPWFRDQSSGRFTVSFETHPLGRLSAENDHDCLRKAMDATGPPFTNVVALGQYGDSAGLGTPGEVSDRAVNDVAVLDAPPTVRRRGAWVTGAYCCDGFLPDRALWVHELGHTLHWPHSYVGSASNSYTNPVDIMSRASVTPEETDVPGCFTAGWCDWPQNTLAFNRTAAGWVDDDQIAVHRSGRAIYELDRPLGGGTQLVAAIWAQSPYRLVTIEARPMAGNDQFFEKAGVALHFVDQIRNFPECTSCWFDDVSGNRTQAPVVGEPYSYDHVLGVGEHLTVHGLTVEVLAERGDGYVIAVDGQYVAPEVTLRN